MPAVESLPSPHLPPSPTYSDAVDEANQRPRREFRKPKIFTYDTLGSPACYSTQTLPYYPQQTMPWVYSVHPYYLRVLWTMLIHW